MLQGGNGICKSLDVDDPKCQSYWDVMNPFNDNKGQCDIYTWQMLWLIPYVMDHIDKIELILTDLNEIPMPK